ncbi:Citrate-binding protein [Platanthera guangdongensis]|uniref:Citrate-binding protein n=1 Tax=Platanthera guangdongensis TaxID=2320717 RepID=A0ABR2MRU5_9ASPA
MSKFVSSFEKDENRASRNRDGLSHIARSPDRIPSFFFLLKESVLLCSADPTDGFRHIPLIESNFLLQKPYNLASADRYSYSNGVRRLWVFSTDKPFKSGSSTDPRTEIRIKLRSEGVPQLRSGDFPQQRPDG